MQRPRFILFAMSRSGSTLLAEALRSHPDVRSVIREPFNPRHPRSEVIAAWPLLLGARQPDPLTSDYTRAFGWLFEQFDGFKIMDYQCEIANPTWARLREWQEVRYVLCARRNLLDRYASEQLAESTEVWNSSERVTRPLPVLTVAPAAAVADVAQRARWLDHALAALPGAAVVYYEELITDWGTVVARVQAHIGLRHWSVAPGLFKVGPVDYRELVPGYDGLVAVCRAAGLAAHVPVEGTRAPDAHVERGSVAPRPWARQGSPAPEPGARPGVVAPRAPDGAWPGAPEVAAQAARGQGAGSTAGAPPRVEVAIITVRREVDYLPQTLASLFMADPDLHRLPPVRLLVGSPDSHYVADLAHHERLRVEPMAPAEWSAIRDWPVHRRLAYNYWRALSIATDARDGICVCEDDIIFRDGFLRRLLATIDEIGQREPARYVLTAYSMHDAAAAPARRRGRYYVAYEPTSHWGNCCVFVPRAALPEAAAFMKRHAVDEPDAPADLVLGRFGAELRLRGEGAMFQTVASLVQHVGYVSGGTSGAYFHSSTFDRPWPD